MTESEYFASYDFSIHISVEVFLSHEIVVGVEFDYLSINGLIDAKIRVDGKLKEVLSLPFDRSDLLMFSVFYIQRIFGSRGIENLAIEIYDDFSEGGDS